MGNESENRAVEEVATGRMGSTSSGTRGDRGSAEKQPIIADQFDPFLDGMSNGMLHLRLDVVRRECVVVVFDGQTHRQ